MAQITNELLYETLKKMHADIGDIKRELREVKVEINSLRSIIGDLIKSDAHRQSNLASLEIRIERIERRLDLHDPPPG